MGKTDRQTLRITRITLDNWRNFTTVDVALAGRVFLVGPNASGKSNFLDAIRFLRDIVVEGGLSKAVEKRVSISSIRCLAARQHPDVGVTVTLGTDGAPDLWRYALKFSQDERKRPMVKSEIIAHEGRILLKRPVEEDGRDPEQLTQTHLEQVKVNERFRDIVVFLKEVRYLHIVPQLVREPDRSVGKRNDPFGGDFLERLASTTEKKQKARLERIREALEVAVPQLMELELYRDHRGTPHLRGRYRHWRPRGAWQSEESFSDGTLRLLGLLWAILNGSGPLLLEEPELSLHADVVRHIPQMFARMQRRTGRQVVVSTHSADLLRDEGIGMNEVLLLTPTENGTVVRATEDIKEVKAIVESGLSLAEAVIPQTRPPRVEQISLFGD